MNKWRIVGLILGALLLAVTCMIDTRFEEVHACHGFPPGHGECFTVDGSLITGIFLSGYVGGYDHTEHELIFRREGSTTRVNILN